MTTAGPSLSAVDLRLQRRRTTSWIGGRDVRLRARARIARESASALQAPSRRTARVALTVAPRRTSCASRAPGRPPARGSRRSPGSRSRETQTCERDDCARACEKRARLTALRTFGFAPSASGASRTLRVGDDDEDQRPRECLPHEACRLDTAAGRRRRRRRLVTPPGMPTWRGGGGGSGRRWLRSAAAVVGRRARVVVVAVVARVRVRSRGERERGREAHQGTGCEQARPDSAYARSSRFSVDTNVRWIVRHDRVDACRDRPGRGRAARRRSRRRPAAPRACARRTARGLTSSWWSTSARSPVRARAAVRRAAGVTSAGARAGRDRTDRPEAAPLVPIPSRSSGKRAPTRMRGSSRASRRSASDVKGAEQTSLQRARSCAERPRRLRERARRLEIDVDADLRRLVGEERERLVERGQLGASSRRSASVIDPIAPVPHRDSLRGGRPSARRRARPSRKREHVELDEVDAGRDAPRETTRACSPARAPPRRGGRSGAVARHVARARSRRAGRVGR